MNPTPLLDFMAKTSFVHGSVMNLFEDFMIQSKLKSLEDLLDPPKRWFSNQTSCTFLDDKWDENTEPIVHNDASMQNVELLVEKPDDSTDSQIPEKQAENNDEVADSNISEDVHGNTILQSVVIQGMDSQADDENSDYE